MRYSFIVPAYNVGKYLTQCIESILSQTYRDFEVILVDDGSTDDTAKVCDTFANIDDRISVINRENGGLSVARNTGITSARGDYLIFIDGDDFWPSTDSLMKLDKELTKTPDCDFIGFNCSYYYPSTNRFEQWVKFADEIGSVKNGKDCIHSLVASGTFPMSACLKVINRNFFLNNNLWFIPGLYSEDIPWFIKMMNCAKAIRFINLYIYGYRKEVEGSISSTFSMKKFTDLVSIIETGVQQTTPEDKALLSFWAYELAITSGMLAFLSKENYAKYYNWAKSYRYLFKYTLNPKVKRISLVNRALGFKVTSKLLSIFMSRKMNNCN